ARATAVGRARARPAPAQGRACHVSASAGPAAVLEMAMGVDIEGVGHLARFLGQGFGGGTDIGAPLERAIARLEEAEWQLADLLIASDGEFGATPALVERVHAVRRACGLRVQGILIGDRETIGLLEITDDIHWVRDWRRYAGVSAAGAAGVDGVADAARGASAGGPQRGEGLEAGGSPVHSKSI